MIINIKTLIFSENLMSTETFERMSLWRFYDNQYKTLIFSENFMSTETFERMSLWRFYENQYKNTNL